VTNQSQIWGNAIWGKFIIQRYLLYDPHTPGAGIIYNEWSDPRLGRTGQDGFEVLRKRGMAAGSLYVYNVRPGDTLPDLADRFGAIPESLAQANPGLDLAHLVVGQPLKIPIPPYPLRSPEPTQEALP
jgi:LysM repeat protein